MTSKTFECMNPVVELTITKGSNGNINFIINHDLRGNTKATLEKSAGAHAALAILEAAGVEARHHSAYENGTPEAMERIAQALADEIGIAEAATAEAKEQAELEAEALELCNAHRSAEPGCEPLSEWAGSVWEESKQHWLAVARRAREMRKS